MIEFVLVVLTLSITLIALVIVWKSNRRLHIVKDCRLSEERYYWESIEGKVLNPVFTKLSEAKYWWVAYEFSSYKGPERRQRIDDRRQDTEARRAVDAKFDVVDLDQGGRRLTDRELTPDIER
jgi:hypothetical protein